MWTNIGLTALLLCFTARFACGQEEAEKKDPAPEFKEIDAWINSDGLKMSDLKGRVVVLHFWAFACINCQRNLPHYLDWQKTFAKEKVTLIGIHTPETGEERELERLQAKVKENKITYPVAFDKNSTMWKAWYNQYWPSVYLVDKQGRVRYRWQGELNWKDAGGQEIMKKKIKELLDEKD